MAKSLFEHRLVAALVLCLSGLALLPFNPLPTGVFGWEQLAGAYVAIFDDNFEWGNLKRWDYVAPDNLRIFPTEAPDTFRERYRIDPMPATADDGQSIVLLAGFSTAADAVFSVEARIGEVGLEMRIGAAVDGGDWVESEWRQIDSDALLEVEWQRGQQIAQDGFVFLSADGVLTGWLTELDNDSLTLESTAITKSGARMLLLPLNGGN